MDKILQKTIWGLMVVLGLAYMPTASAVTATGGNITNIAGYTIHIFTNNGTFTVLHGGNVDILIVAGGGGGGGTIGGGGGAGGLLYTNSCVIASGSNAVVVGGGGVAGVTQARGGSGTNSSLGALIAYGGGGGGGWASGSQPGLGGGSGGGAAGWNGVMAGGACTNGQGKMGGSSPSSNGNGGAGGGGFSLQGTNGAPTVAGGGGAGVAYDISGVSTYYAGGGGGGARSGAAVAAPGGAGGGGNGASNGVGSSATANTGGGGGGGGFVNPTYYSGGKGGSGIVIVRYLDSDPVVDNSVGASNITATSADLNGALVSTGAAPTVVFVFWGPADGGTNVWANTNVFDGFQGPGPLATNVGVTAGGEYFYRYGASNAYYSTSWSPASGYFLTTNVTALATPTLIDQQNATGTFWFVRPSAMTGGAVTVNFTVGGTAANGVDYTLSSSSPITLPVGVCSASVQAVSIPNSVVDGDKTLVISVAAGNCYLLGGGSSATLAIANTPLSFTWKGGANGNWFGPANWSLPGVPGAGDTVAITNGSVLLTNSTAILASFMITNATLTFTNWNSLLTASNVMIQSGGILKLPGSFTAVGAAHNIYMTCSNLTIQAGALIDADATGYRGGNSSHVGGYGPGGGSGSSGGGGHGGRGGGNYGGATYDDYNAPLLPGSGGAVFSSGDPSTGAAGGGAIRIQADGQVNLMGIIRANGANATGWLGVAGGSGGSVYLTCSTLTGSNGVIQVNGGRDAGQGGGGGGGCIAISYNTTAQALLPKPDLQFSANYAIGNSGAANGSIGTLSVSDAQLLPESGTNFNYRLYGLTSWAPSQLAITNAWLGITGSSFQFAVSNALTLFGSSAHLDLETTNASCGNLTVDNATLTLTGLTDAAPSLQCNGNFLLTNAAKMYVYPCRTNDLTTAYGALVTVTNTLTVGASAAIYPYANTNGGATVLFRAGNLTVEAGGQFNADYKGYPGFLRTAYGMGPGAATTWNGGGGYGGRGGGAGGGVAYGSSNAPTDCGSSGAPQDYAGMTGAEGGGAIRVEASNGTINILGVLTANGRSYSGANTQNGGGAGGTINLNAHVFIGNGTISANGGGGGTGTGSGGGGGGRIALISTADGFTGPVTVTPGGGTSGTLAQTGSLVRIGGGGFLNLHVKGSPTQHGSATPYNYTVASPHGVLMNSAVLNTVNSPADEANGTRYLCLGWMLTNSAGPVASGATPAASFSMTTNLVLTYRWTNSHYLTTTSGLNGQLQIDVSGWYTNGAAVTMAAVADPGHHFLQWSGAGVPDGQQTVNPLTVVMDRPRTIQANYASDTAGTRTWSGTGDWLDPARWSPVGIPGELDTVIIPAATTNRLSTPVRVGSITVRTNAMLSFSNWATRLTATDVIVNSNGVITVAGSFTESQMSNRVYITCQNLTLDKGGLINVKELGYARAVNRVGWGPGKGYLKGGGGHGGVGANNTGLYGQTYGNSNAPAFPGSSGGSETSGGDPYWGGGGGGAVWLEVTNLVTLNGVIDADGGPGGGWSGDAGGSGGSIYISCLRLYGTTGELRARGGLGMTGANGGGGGGGRIAVWRVLDMSSGLQASVVGGNGGGGAGGAGTWVLSGASQGSVFAIR